MKFVGGGGLGDALMMYCKLHAYLAEHSDVQNVELTHVEVPDILLPQIGEFYRVMGVKAEVKKIDSWDWMSQHIHEYDVYLDTSWHQNDRSGFQGMAFPPMPDDIPIEWDFCIAPFAGRGRDRQIQRADIVEFVSLHPDKKIVIIGNGNEEMRCFFDGLGVANKINSTSIQDVLNIILSSEKIISNIGFIPLFAAAAKKRVYSIPIDATNTAKYVHPDWDFHTIHTILDVI